MQKPERIARIILEGFDRHYRLFREISANAREHFEAGRWESAWGDNRNRIRMYEARVRETVESIESRQPGAAGDADLWPGIKRYYIGLLLDHPQAECAETFYNSVACRVLHRRYYNNENIFWRPALNTDNLEGEQQTFRTWYPQMSSLRRCLLEVLRNTGLANPWEDLRRDVRRIERVLRFGKPGGWSPQPDHQLQVLGSLFFRNKAAYVVARLVQGDRIRPLILPILQNDQGQIYVDAALTRNKEASSLFSFTRAYFMVDMEIPSAYVDFLLSILPNKSRVDLYAILGLQKQAKTLFYRELHHHLKHSTDNFEIAPGIPGTVMLVFSLPSFPFVIKVIKDRFEPPKTTNHQHVRDCYTLVKFHDRVGRLADTLEYSNVAIPKHRIDPGLMQEMEATVAGSISSEGDKLIIAHCYIERRMTPLNEFLATADPATRKPVLKDYGQAIRDLAGANIFPGDMMQKNFGVTRFNRVVFYDYDEICYLTDCNFRTLPASSDPLDEISVDPWYSVQDNDVFPETFGSFFCPNPQQRDAFLKSHAELMDPVFWRSTQAAIRSGEQLDVFPYAAKYRFEARFG
jgi:isocitrate dehydrogenase kinase/phosphatase